MGQSLRELANKRGIYIGAAVNVDLLAKDREYKGLLQKEFNMVVPENVMKWKHIRPDKNTFSFEKADELVAFAEGNKMVVRGHTLVWGTEMPDWFVQLNSEEMYKSLEEHINKVAGRYKKKIYAWDVINEALTDEGEFNNDCLTRTIGPKYLELSLKLARETDPNAKLFWNEWGADCLNKRSDKFYELVKELLSKKIPLDGVGFQMHTGLGRPKTTTPLPDVENVRKNFERFEKLGLEIHITEMDVQIQDGQGSWNERLDQEADFYRDILKMTLDISNFKAIVLWGVNDKYSWISNWLTHNEDAPLLFDKNNKPKPAYFAIKEVLEKGK